MLSHTHPTNTAAAGASALSITGIQYRVPSWGGAAEGDPRAACFFRWLHITRASASSSEAAGRRCLLKRGISAMKGAVSEGRAEEFAHKHLLMRCFKAIRFQVSEEPTAVLSSPVHVWSCFRIIAACFGDSEPEYRFPWDALAALLGSSSRVSRRLRVYAIGKLFISPKKLPLLLHATALIDTYVMRAVFSAWKCEWSAIRRLRARCEARLLRGAISEWRAASTAARQLREEEAVRQRESLRSAFSAWRSWNKDILAQLSMSNVRKRLALRYWFHRVLYAKHCRRAFDKIYPYIAVQRKVRAFEAWTIVWTYRLQLQRFANQVVCTHYRTVTRNCWKRWSRAAAIFAARRLRLQRLEAQVLRRRRDFLALENVRTKRSCFQMWMLRAWDLTRGRKLLATWAKVKNRRRLRSALVKWILVISLDSLATRVQRCWRGHVQRKVSNPEVPRYLDWFRRQCAVAILFRCQTAKRRAFLAWSITVRSSQAAQEMDCDFYSMRRAMRSISEHRLKRVVVQTSAAVWRRKVLQESFRMLSSLVSRRGAMTSLMITCETGMKQFVVARAFDRFKLFTHNHSHIRNLVERKLLFARPSSFFLRLKERVGCSMDRTRRNRRGYYALLNFHFNALLAKLAIRIHKRKLRDKRVFDCLCRNAFLRWLARARNVRLQREPGHKLRFHDLKRLDSLLLDRSDPRRSAFLVATVAKKAHFNDLARPDLAKGQFYLTSRRGTIALLFRRWLRRTFHRSQSRKQLMDVLSKIYSIDIRRCFRQLMGQAFSTDRLSRRYRKKLIAHMTLVRVQTAFKTLRAFSAIKRRSTRLINRIHLAYLNTFRYMRTWAQQRRLSRARFQIGATSYRIRRLAKAMRIWIHRAPQISYQPLDKCCASLQLFNDALKLQDISRRSRQSHNRAMSIVSSSLLPPNPDESMDVPTRRNVSTVNSRVFPATINASVRSDRPLDSSIRTEWAARMDRTARFSEFDTSATSDHFIDDSFLSGSYRNQVRVSKSPESMAQMRRKLSKLLQNRMKARLLDPIHSRYINSISLQSNLVGEGKAELLWTFSAMRRGVRALFRYAYFVQTIRACRLKLELRPIMKYMKTIYKRRCALRQQVKSISVRILLRLLRGTFNAWSLYTLKQVRIRTQAAVVASATRHSVLALSWRAWLQARRQRELTILSDILVQLHEKKVLARALKRWKRAKLMTRIIPDALKEMTFSAWVRYLGMRREKKRSLETGDMFFISSKVSSYFTLWRRQSFAKSRRDQRSRAAADHMGRRRVHILFCYWMDHFQTRKFFKAKSLGDHIPLVSSGVPLQTPHSSRFNAAAFTSARNVQPSARRMSMLSTSRAGSTAVFSAESRPAVALHQGSPAFAQRRSSLPSHLSTPSLSKPNHSATTTGKLEEKKENHRSQLFSASSVNPPETPYARAVAPVQSSPTSAARRVSVAIPPAAVIDNAHTESNNGRIQPRRTSLISTASAVDDDSDLKRMATPAAPPRDAFATMSSSGLSSLFPSDSTASAFDEFYTVWSEFVLFRAVRKWKR